jgi:hypothetical protein
MDIEILEFKLKSNNYTIKFPNVGQIEDIECTKQLISKGMYSSLMQMGTRAANDTLDMIDMEAFFSILCPDLVKDLKSDSFRDLGIVDFMELKKAYIKQFVPWWVEIQKILRPIDE